MGTKAGPPQAAAVALPDTAGQEAFRENIVKMNLSSLAFNNYSLSYERSLTRKISFVAGYRFMPETSVSSFPLAESTIDRFLTDEEDVVDVMDRATLANNTYTGEIRFYTGRKPGASGFYLSLYGRYMNMRPAYTHDYDTGSRTYTLPFDGTLRGLGGGVMIGSQWLIAKRVALDWYILGGHYGKLKGNLSATADLSTMTETEKRGLQEDIELANNKLNGNVDVEATVTDRGVDVKGTAPFAGIRGLGLSLGIAF
ncbi:DUF3575 domain-containing protein [Pontibacter russatus]|uniref:DUF3575 domain-containing protein n=1 Tax=Pontibacter russatus TaxID=2694929 RepID=UPI001F46E758|nr:DUF3575 domain-containing protein [Pontibacter russatus]